MKSLIASITILGLVGMVVGVVVFADTTDTVTATVTVQSISVSVDDGTVTYGTLAVDTSADTAGSSGDSQTATNNGNVTEDLNIKGQNSTSAGAGWILAASAGSETYVHEFCRGDTGNCDGAPVWTALTTNYQTLDTSVATTDTQVFDLKITTPTSTIDFNEQSVDVTVQAVAG